MMSARMKGGDGGDHVGFGQSGGDAVDGDPDSVFEFAGQAECERGLFGECLGQSEHACFRG